MMDTNPLGRETGFPRRYAPEALVPIPRSKARERLGITAGRLPFKGADVWNAYELSWLDIRGKPHAAVGRFVVPCDSPNMVESKSMKLYLASLNQESYANRNQVASLIRRDLSRIAGSGVDVSLHAPGGAELVSRNPLQGTCLDGLDVEMSTYEVDAGLLSGGGEPVADEVVYTDLFRSKCPITAQPDWAAVSVRYRGRKISHESLLRYLVSYRCHNDYHENCVESIFMDIMNRCRPQALIIKAQFLRRGGIDINPVRGTFDAADDFSHSLHPRQ